MSTAACRPADATGHLRMQGKEVFRHAVEKLAETAHAALDKAGLTGAAMSTGSCRTRPTSASYRSTAQRMQVPMDRVVVTVQDHGNTSAASIPLALSVARRGQIKQGDLVVTEAIGGGLAWGAVVLRW
jgi:3-oxoacyl-[acyl-carrier-protein] synthase III